VSLLGGEALVPLLGNGELDALALRQRDVRLVSLPCKQRERYINAL
jgi:hypothetical protein